MLKVRFVSIPVPDWLGVISIFKSSVAVQKTVTSDVNHLPLRCPVNQVGANSNDDRAEEAVRRSQSSNPALDIAFRRGGEAMEGSGAPPGVGYPVNPGAGATGNRAD